MTDLGRECTTLMMAVRGETTVKAAKELVNSIIHHIGMSPIFEPVVYQYEENVGIIYIQPIYESFVAYDAWPCHGGGYVAVLSCREFMADVVLEVVRKAGYEVVDYSLTGLTLCDSRIKQNQSA